MKISLSLLLLCTVTFRPTSSFTTLSSSKSTLFLSKKNNVVTNFLSSSSSSTTTSNQYSSSSLSSSVFTDDTSDTSEKDSNSNNNNNNILVTDTVLTTKSSVLDKDLTSDERSTVNVVRRRAPSVAYVTSYSIPSSTSNSRRQRFNNNNNNNKNSNKINKETTNNNNKQTVPPARSTPLGSGSAFAISSSDGYFVTNYHVIERAYQMKQSQRQMDSFIQNVTKPFLKGPGRGSSNNDSTNDRLSNRINQNRRTAQVYLRLASASSPSSTSSSLVPARIVSVRPELDSAILKIIDTDTDTNTDTTTSTTSDKQTLPEPIPYGSSSRLLVGQSVLAIGNPFGLDQSITSGVVSALDRSVKGIANNQINNCIQTDAAINPGNSGGPLLNSNGECIGMNTMIISTSGSNAGIGFAIPMDDIREYVESEIEMDKMNIIEKESSSSGSSSHKNGKKKGWLGIEILTDVKLQSQLMKRIKQQKKQQQKAVKDDEESASNGIFITKVEQGSPANKGQLKPTTIDKSTSRITIGDRIIAINSKVMNTYQELYADLKTRVVGENLSITVEDKFSERRVVYVELSDKK